MDTVVDRLMRYAKVCSESDYHARPRYTPSTDRRSSIWPVCWWRNSTAWASTMRFVDETCYVYASRACYAGL